MEKQLAVISERLTNEETVRGMREGGTSSKTVCLETRAESSGEHATRAGGGQAEGTTGASRTAHDCSRRNGKRRFEQKRRRGRLSLFQSEDREKLEGEIADVKKEINDLLAQKVALKKDVDDLRVSVLSNELERKQSTSSGSSSGGAPSSEDTASFNASHETKR